MIINLEEKLTKGVLPFILHESVCKSAFISRFI
jgi:hypothetical protein